MSVRVAILLAYTFDRDSVHEFGDGTQERRSRKRRKFLHLHREV